MSQDDGRTLGIEPATIDIAGRTPRAPAYDDVYFSADDGLAESRHVFLDGNDLATRWARWSASRAFVIGETGFGTGRNMLLAWRLFREVAPAAARLHLVSIERHPLCADDLRALWADDPELHGNACRLANGWPALLRGTHRLRLDDRVTLDLIFDDVDTALNGFDGRVDAWFLDGFAPARNPAMWSARVFAGLAAASRPGATFATYSCARAVREHAAAVGFECEKRPGAGRKREMLQGRLASTTSAPAIAAARRRRPWFEPPRAGPVGRIAVIGAGIAGTSVAEALARRGQRCDLYDPLGVAGAASGNAQAALHVRPAANGDARTRFQLAALDYVRRWLADLDSTRTLWSDCGLLQLARDEAEAARQRKCLDRLAVPPTLMRGVDAATAARLAGTPLSGDVRGGLYYSSAGWVRPDRLCRLLFERSGATLYRRAVTALESIDSGWRLANADGGRADYEHVVLACAGAAPALCVDLPPLTTVRGQVSAFASTDPAFAPDCVICGRGYALPALEDRLYAGASFQRDRADAAARSADDDANRAMLAEIAPALATRLGPPVAARVAFRCTGHDRMPCVGPVPDTAAWRRDYAALALDARRIPDVPGRHRRGLWTSLAHGAHGLVSAPLSAEILASRLCDEPVPRAAGEVDALHPGRWFVRELIRGG
ncbi:bifunctional tRNA (5-methylaminomethyl-2-thiouridine)(34)-methyltransferase MnmD/FAD-dependent 5-carboxymethylaminomethyl-2-thiouridine(34) oxidoreductase MnmC [Salinisphaera hydrothermalis]|uniref:bifunctional tRNA (5-methylaminomethyl-2-thiouridine)(34)-methyltransferase MnmD/FAD-dependent 5-carboxymethylaminomethyl-2-thiouridine(34) oxidoreductase MnmC n=1 Tax=Salinisphaera hydrothermalis TaxID=563188 RepID=UPI003342C25D